MNTFEKLLESLEENEVVHGLTSTDLGQWVYRNDKKIMKVVEGGKTDHPICAGDKIEVKGDNPIYVPTDGRLVAIGEDGHTNVYLITEKGK